MSGNTKNSVRKTCCFCRSSEDNEIVFGKFYEHSGIVTHYYCMLLSSNMEQKGNDNEGILGFLTLDIQKEIRRGKRLTCTYCKKAGATLGCCNTKCKKIFHYPCGLKAGSLHQFFGEFRSYCMHHRPKQKIDSRVKQEVKNTDEILCYICYDEAYPQDFINTLWAPCCKKNTWFHRKCVQQLALSAGYFFKCPLCNNKKEFQAAMLEFGIFIPSQDASWELVPNAFQELLYRHDQCDAPICLCPKGRKHTSNNAKWELLLCRTCGSQGIHMACGELKWVNPVWECRECISILHKANEATNSSRSQNILQNNLDSEDSDSDISVGNDSPVSFISSVIDRSPASSQSYSKLSPELQSSPQLPNNRTSETERNTQLGQNNVHHKTVVIKSVLNTFFGEGLSNNEEVNKTLSCCTRNANQLNQPSVITSNAPVNDIIMIDDSDDEVIETSKQKSTISGHRTTVSKTRELQTSTESVKDNCDLFSLENVLGNNNSNRYDCSNTAMNCPSTNEEKFVNNPSAALSQDKVESSILQDAKCWSQTPECRSSTDSIASIKIVNVVSLAQEEYANVLTANKKQHRTLNDSNFKCMQPLSTDELGNGEDQYLVQENSAIEGNLKRKSDGPYDDDRTIACVSTSIQAESYKKVKGNQLNQNGQSNSVTPYVDTSQQNEPNNDQVHGRIERNHTMHSSDSAIYSEVISPTDHSKRERGPSGRTNDGAHEVSSEFIRHANKTTNKVKNSTIVSLNDDKHCLGNQTNQQNGNITIHSEKNPRNCDGNAGVGFMAEPGNDHAVNKTFGTDSTRVSAKSGHWCSTSDSQQMRTNTSTRATSTEPTRHKDSTSNYSRLIPGHVSLRDLKFRVHDSNNLQMILYDQFSVNINMNASVGKHNKHETLKLKATRSKISGEQCESSSTVEYEDVLNDFEHVNKYLNAIPTSSISNKDKYKYGTNATGCVTNCRDDTKENLDPVTASCKTVSDDSIVNASSIEDDLTFCMKGNPNDEECSVQCPHSTSKIVEVDVNNKWHNRDKVSLGNSAAVDPSTVNVKLTDRELRIVNMLNADEPLRHVPSCAVTCGDGKHLKNVSKLKTDVENLYSDYVSSSTAGKEDNNTNAGSNSYNLMKQMQRALVSRDSVNSTTKSKTGTCLAVSIDLNKIQHFIDTNPNIFSKHKKGNDMLWYKGIGFLNERKGMSERINIQNRHVLQSTVDGSGHFSNFNYSSSKDKVVQWANCTNKTTDGMEIAMIKEDNLMKETKMLDNSILNNQKRGLKRSNRHFEEQSALDR